MWSQEPAGTSSGIAPGPIQQAVRDLQAAPSGTPCYAAAIADLAELETATPSEIAATASTGGPRSQDAQLVGGRIMYLNIFFGANGGLAHWVLNQQG